MTSSIPGKIEIRPLLASDAPEVEAIFVESRDSATVPIGSHWTSEQIAAECRDGNGVVAFDGAPSAAILGFIFYRDLYEAWEISFLAVSPNARRRGVMRALLQAVVTSMPEGKSLWLEVHEANLPARRLYESFGFKQVGRRPRYYADGGAACLYNYG